MLYVQSGAFFDISSNYLDAVVAMPITELKDVIQPNIMRVTLNLMNGTLLVEFDEHIQTSASSSWINTTRIFISNTSNITSLYSSRDIALTGATVRESGDALIATIILTERQRVASIRVSGTPGGDSHAALLTADEGAFFDISENTQMPLHGLTIDEILDDLRPK